MRVIYSFLLDEFRDRMVHCEMSKATVDKYMRDMKAFTQFACRENGGEPVVTKETVIRYKEYLSRNYKNTSSNSMLAAINHFFRLNEWTDCVVKPFKIQREAFRRNERDLSTDEYKRLLNAARSKGNIRLELIMETICATGIRVSELQYITVESTRKGVAEINIKGKMRSILIVPKLVRKLRDYAKERGISRGPIFVSRTGKVLDRSNILHDMKALCMSANVDSSKVFPHNLRHLFALTYYRIEKDLAHLADILGHSNINTTRIYTACTRFEQMQVIQKLGFVT